MDIEPWAIVTYQGSTKNFLVELAEQLNISTVEAKQNKDGEITGERQLTVDELKDKLAADIKKGTLLIIPEAKRLPASIRYWLEPLMKMGKIIVLAIAVAVVKRDIYLQMLEVELERPSIDAIRGVILEEAQKNDLALTDHQIAKLLTVAGRNPLLARKAVRNEKLGLNPEPEHTQYLDISPIIISAMFAFSIVRFIGLGTGDRGLYVIGGIALVLGVMLRQIGKIRGARRKYGQ
ncbi:hypothetical protein [Picosynechococcus sp. NKBG15041c]|uniref:hypothetical protein n=1 Tax=Picosynechococcus sp. NKBG15041c TaxID=1407650 RepID=UPI0003FDDD04|nr:hypothetical protein [Picosynechococcus sp. NKBG15041c]